MEDPKNFYPRYAESNCSDCCRYYYTKWGQVRQNNYDLFLPENNIIAACRNEKGFYPFRDDRGMGMAELTYPFHSALAASGALSLGTTAGTDRSISGEFGGTTPHGLSEYYSAADGVPSSGTIDFSDFHGKAASAGTFCVCDDSSASAETGYGYVGNGGTRDLNPYNSSCQAYCNTQTLDDSSTGPYDMGFYMCRGGECFCQIYVSTNGWIAFENNYGAFYIFSGYGTYGGVANSARWACGSTTYMRYGGVMVLPHDMYQNDGVLSPKNWCDHTNTGDACMHYDPYDGTGSCAFTVGWMGGTYYSVYRNSNFWWWITLARDGSDGDNCQYIQTAHHFTLTWTGRTGIKYRHYNSLGTISQNECTICTASNQHPYQNNLKSEVWSSNAAGTSWTAHGICTRLITCYANKGTVVW